MALHPTYTWAMKGVAIWRGSAVQLDGTVGRAPPKTDPALNSSRGGYSPQSHSLTDRQGRPCA